MTTQQSKQLATKSVPGHREAATSVQLLGSLVALFTVLIATAEALALALLLWELTH